LPLAKLAELARNARETIFKKGISFGKTTGGSKQIDIYNDLSKQKKEWKVFPSQILGGQTVVQRLKSPGTGLGRGKSYGSRHGLRQAHGTYEKGNVFFSYVCATFMGDTGGIGILRAANSQLTGKKEPTTLPKEQRGETRSGREIGGDFNKNGCGKAREKLRQPRAAKSPGRR